MDWTTIILALGFLVTNVTLLLTRGPKGDTGSPGPTGVMGERGIPGRDCC